MTGTRATLTLNIVYDSDNTTPDAIADALSLVLGAAIDREQVEGLMALASFGVKKETS